MATGRDEKFVAWCVTALGKLFVLAQNLFARPFD
jgi:hypothetical protein